jgi:hypothetical protein
MLLADAKAIFDIPSIDIPTNVVVTEYEWQIDCDGQDIKIVPINSSAVTYTVPGDEGGQLSCTLYWKHTSGITGDLIGPVTTTISPGLPNPDTFKLHAIHCPTAE